MTDIAGYLLSSAITRSTARRTRSRLSRSRAGEPLPVEFWCRRPINTRIAVVLPIWKVLEAMEQPKIQELRKKVLNASNRDKGGGFVPSSVGAEPV
jgi:hypothetical protein